MIKKSWSLLTVLILAAMILSACATATTQAPVATVAPTATTAAPVTITIWHQWSGDYLTAIQAVFNQYMAEHTNVTIVLDAPQDVTSALQVAIPAGEGPDIIGWANDQIGKQAIQGNIVDLGTLGVTQDFLASTFEPAAVNGVVWQGKIWALPESQEAIAIVYNKAAVTEADFPTDPMDFTGLLSKAQAYATANPGKYLVCNQGLGGSDPYHEAPVYFGFGVPGYVDDTGKVYLNTPEAIAAATWIKQFSAVSPKEASYDICNAGITDGTFASWWTGPWAIANLETAGIDYGILPMGKPFVGIKTLMITKNAVDRGTAALALDIMKYYTNQANETTVALANKTIPANTAALTDPQIQALYAVKQFGAAAKLGVPMANTPYADAQWTPVGDATQAIWNGSQTPEAALAAAQTAIETAIAAMK
jgi:arabinogalactan oligomer/maltooligosaccharide transport system substrate-binding protein